MTPEECIEKLTPFVKSKIHITDVARWEVGKERHSYEISFGEKSFDAKRLVGFRDTIEQAYEEALFNLQSRFPFGLDVILPEEVITPLCAE